MEISLEKIQELRQRTGVGVMDAKAALQEHRGDIEEAILSLRQRGEKVSQKKEGRATKQGVVGTYIHPNHHVVGVVVIRCETDFVERTDSFKNLAHDIAMQIAATKPKYLNPEAVPTEVLEAEKEIYRAQLDASKPPAIQDKIISGKLDKFFEEHCLLNQKFIKDDSLTIDQLLKQQIAAVGENIKLDSFGVFEI